MFTRENAIFCKIILFPSCSRVFFYPNFVPTPKLIKTSTNDILKSYLQKCWPPFGLLTRNKSLFLWTLKNEVRRFWWWIKKKSSSNNVWTHKTSIKRINKNKTLIKITFFFFSKCFIRILDKHINGHKFLFSLKTNFCMVTSSIGKMLFFGKSQIVVNKKRAWVFHHWNKTK